MTVCLSVLFALALSLTAAQHHVSDHTCASKRSRRLFTRLEKFPIVGVHSVSVCQSACIVCLSVPLTAVQCHASDHTWRRRVSVKAQKVYVVAMCRVSVSPL